MAGGGGAGGAWSRRVAVRARALRGLARDTGRALRDARDVLPYDADIPRTVQEIAQLAARPTALVVLGASWAARGRLLHALLGRRVLPDSAPRARRCLRFLYGSSTQVHLTVGDSEFELVGELEANAGPWDTLPVGDLIRKDDNDLSTVLEIELDNSLLKDGLQIVLPPDIAEEPADSGRLHLERTHAALRERRARLLTNFNPVYLFAIDRIGGRVFRDGISCNNCNKDLEDGEGDFWAKHDLYSWARAGGAGGEGGVGVGGAERAGGGGAAPPARGQAQEPVLDGENCMDLHQVKEMDPHAQLLFVLFSDSVPLREKERDGTTSPSPPSETSDSEPLQESDRGLTGHGVIGSTSESPDGTRARERRLREEQTEFLSDLLDQWEMMTKPPPKHYYKSQTMILNDADIALGAQGGPAGGRRGAGAGGARGALLGAAVRFAGEAMHCALLQHCTRLSEIHVKLLQQFILASFDLARELQVVPRKIQYAASQESHLYESICEKFSGGDKQQELVLMMRDVLRETRAEIEAMDWSVDNLPCHQDLDFLLLSNSVLYSSESPDKVSIPLWNVDSTEMGRSGNTGHAGDTGRSGDTADPSSAADDPASDVEEAVSYDSYNFDDYEILHSNMESVSAADCCHNRVASPEEVTSLSSQINLIPVENERECSSTVSSAMRSWVTGRSAADSCAASVSYKQASLDVQHTVLTMLSRKISLKLVRFVDCLHDSYFGTLQRCLESLEESCRAELGEGGGGGGGRPASDAVRQLLAGARRVDLLPCASFSLLRTVLDSLLRLFSRLRPGPGAACCALSAAWRRQVARRTHGALSEQRLARLISAQILERLAAAHARCQAALGSLRGALAQRLHHSGGVKRAIRKKYAPEFARLCLESTSMCDLLMYGTPELGREIGRGQYGVVYAGRAGWAGRAPVAVKSVQPADERHYSELAMEFFYTRSIPPHPRVVRLYGSVVQRHGGAGAGGGGPPAVLLVSPRYRRDLHAAVRAGLGYAPRLRVGCDIVEGIRYLHSLGLVHRDIKMMNVLLDARDRAALADLGFCAAEALISGSVVGTPVHMAPELLAGRYDASVDVYAFGILFWYLCAGRVRLPAAFEAFHNKEQLWLRVKKGLRPERLACFSDECWDIMRACWAAEPAARALLGDVQPRLEALLREALRDPRPDPDLDPRPDPDPDPDPCPDPDLADSCDGNTDDDSLQITM